MTKVIPDVDTLATAWRRAREVHRINRLIDELLAEPESDQPVPQDLAELVREQLESEPRAPWDDVVADLARPHGEAA